MNWLREDKMPLMSFLKYFFAVLICFSGLIFGHLVSKIAREELAAGKKYFILVQNILLGMMLFSILQLFQIGIVISIVLAVLFSFLASMFRNFDRNIFFYLTFGVVLFIASRNFEIFLIVSALIFIYGFPTSALLMEGPKSRIKVLRNPIARIFLYFIWFVFVSIALYLSGV